MTGALGLLSIKSITYLTFTVFLIAAAGYLLGRVTIKGINLGTAGVFIAALLYGCFFYSSLETNLVVGDVSFAKEALKIVENVGLVLFVSSVGFIAGPSFFRNLKKNYKSYVSLGLIIILAAVLAAILALTAISVPLIRKNKAVRIAISLPPYILEAVLAYNDLISPGELTLSMFEEITSLRFMYDKAVIVSVNGGYLPIIVNRTIFSKIESSLSNPIYVFTISINVII